MYKQKYKCHIAGSKQEAIKKGYARYLGKPCLRGHTGVRYISGGCVTCNREKKAKAVNRLRPPLDHSKIDSIDRQFLIDTAEIWDKPI